MQRPSTSITATSRQCLTAFNAVVTPAVAATGPTLDVAIALGNELLAVLNEAGASYTFTDEEVREAATIVITCGEWNMRMVEVHGMEFKDETVFNAVGPVEFIEKLGGLDAIEAKMKEEQKNLN
jgi:hypothetical protein